MQQDTLESGEAALAPRDATDLAEILRSHPRPLEPLGGGSKRGIGRIVDADPLDLRAFSGIVSYEPAELVLTARAATPLAVIRQALEAASQRLAFEPPDAWANPGAAESPTLGGVLAANFAGSRRVAAGAARDHFLGFTAVAGSGDIFKAGAKVVKNVTGYDLPKLLAGSWGTLAVLTEVTVRVAPAPETECSIVIPDRAPAAAVATMSRALGSAYDVSAAAFDPSVGTVLRLEGFASSVESRARALQAMLNAGGARGLDAESSRALWRRLGALEMLADWPVVWRISVPPSDAPRVLAALDPLRYVLDWGGGLIAAAFAALDVERVRGALASGHATVVKAPASERRGAAPLFQPLSALGARVAARVKHAFDPHAKLNPGRMS